MSGLGGGFGGSGFGGPTPPAMPYGQSQQQTPVSGFGSNAAASSSPFRQQQQQPFGQQSSVPNPFASPPPGGAQAQPITFGTSPNHMASIINGGSSSIGGCTAFAAPSSAFLSSVSSGRFGSAPSSGPFGTTAAFSANNNNNSPYGAVASSSGGVTFAAPVSAAHSRQTSSSSVEMGGFSESPTPGSSATAFGTSLHATRTMTGNVDSLSPIPESGMHDPFSGGSGGPSSTAIPFGKDNQESSATGDGRGILKDDKLARLKAKIEAKKKKLLDRQKKEEGKQDGSSGAAEKHEICNNTQHQQQQQEQKSSKDLCHRRGHSHIIPLDVSDCDAQVGASNSGNQSRAVRNAIRFSGSTTNAATRVYMPSELKGNTHTKAVTSAVGGDSSRENLANAKSLVGTCVFMCPDEELIRRERENDIQLLEIPDPGGTHPLNWTLRNTAVKRFRRSAADYKLDVPDWVRPPDVLEEVCGYLEEWVMERDRQGPDRRFPQGGTPNSMDVYQFIWDRTRMIRKDFILQNYVGTGGKCDARAVRCHERIARWHTMCEHQLSHISDFAVMQSQQNIQELGQAMKTLNQYYDDSQGRALVEVPDDRGNETRTEFQNYSHGCESDTVQGSNPVDYDGSSLENSSDSSLVLKRLLGKKTVNTPTRGTAEPEMRALYILLTMDNEGGMEVMRYSARLHQERREIYDSQPVQLALNIFKAKKDYNYVRFFEYIRSPKTPYLFACICFKHVALMRKVALRIMSKTYGAKKKDSGEPIYDAYPLKKLAQIICFEDMGEARAACEHYNITVKEMKVRSSSTGQVGAAEVVLWRHSDFKEPRDPVKGTILQLRPKKMLKYIESKLNGATRLAVCRGEVSGEGASVAKLPSTGTPAMLARTPAQLTQLSAATTSTVAASAVDGEEERMKLLMKRQQELLAEEMKREAEKQRMEKEKAALELAEARCQKQQLEKIQFEARSQQEELKRRQAREQEERSKEGKRREEGKRELTARDARLKEKERKRSLEEEEARRASKEWHRWKLEEAARLKAKAEESERVIQETLRREEVRQKQARAEQERRRQQEEKAELIRKERERKQDEERKRALEERVNKARKALFVRRWCQQIPRSYTAKTSCEDSLKRIDPTFSFLSPITPDFVEHELALFRSTGHSNTAPKRIDIRRTLNRINSKALLPLDVASLMLDIVCSDDELVEHVTPSTFTCGGSSITKTTFLFKIVVTVPEPDGLDLDETSVYEAIHTWLNRCFKYGKTHTVERVDPSGRHVTELRLLFVRADIWAPANCDAAIFVIPPSFCSSDWNNAHKVEAISSAFASIDQETPRIAYVLAEKFDTAFHLQANSFLAACLPTATKEFPVVFSTALSAAAVNGSFVSALKCLISLLAQNFPPSVEQVSVAKLASKVISDSLWRTTAYNSLECAREALVALDKAMRQEGESLEASWSGWPVSDFADEKGLVKNYFGPDNHLPTSWTSRIFRDIASTKIMDLHKTLQKSFPFAVGELMEGTPVGMKVECDSLLEFRQDKKCLQHALQLNTVDDEVIYWPKGTCQLLVEKTIKTVLGACGSDYVAEKLLDRQCNSVELFLGKSEEATTAESAPWPFNHGETVVEKKEDVNDALKAHVIFEAYRTISPLPPPPAVDNDMRTLPSDSDSPLFGTNPPRAGFSSCNKRNWIGMTGSPFIPPASGGYSLSPGLGSQPKRTRGADTFIEPRTLDQLESSAFTKKLEALLKGEITVDMKVGNTTLARLVPNVLPLEATTSAV